MVLNLGLSPPAVWASAAVGFIFGRCSRGQISVQVVGGALVPAARSGAERPAKSVRSGEATSAVTRNR